MFTVVRVACGLSSISFKFWLVCSLNWSNRDKLCSLSRGLRVENRVPNWPIDCREFLLGSFENSYIPENPRTPPISYISQTTTGPPPTPTGPPPAPTTGPPSDHRRTTVGAPLTPIGTSDHCRTTAGPPPPPDHHRTTVGSPPDHHRTPAGPPPDHRRCTTCTHRHIGPLSDHRRTTVRPPPDHHHHRTTIGPPPDHRRCTTCTHRHIGPLPNHRRTIVGLPPM
ncbi:hypothetical protein LXL04_007423 [Taraxacum kok-saghyz]